MSDSKTPSSEGQPDPGERMRIQPATEEVLDSHEKVMQFLETDAFRAIRARILRAWNLDEAEKEDIEQELITAMLVGAAKPGGISNKNAAHYMNGALTKIIPRYKKKRIKGNFAQMPEDLSVFGPPCAPDPQAIAEQNEESPRALAAIACFPRDERIFLNYSKFGFANENFELLADAAGCSLATAHRRVVRLKEKLQSLMEDSAILRAHTEQAVTSHLRTAPGAYRWRTLCGALDRTDYDPDPIYTVHAVRPGIAIVCLTFQRFWWFDRDKVLLDCRSKRRMDWLQRKTGRQTLDFVPLLVSAITRPWFAPDSECIWRYDYLSPRIMSLHYNDVVARHLQSVAESPRDANGDYEASWGAGFESTILHLRDLRQRHDTFLQAGRPWQEFVELHAIPRRRGRRGDPLVRGVQISGIDFSIPEHRGDEILGGRPER
jgi:DNA-directed RNA polymerase specialized sigma24 family protein